MVEVNFENFPQLIDAMGGVTYTGGCVISVLDGGFKRGRLHVAAELGNAPSERRAGARLARIRENLCAPHETDLQREVHQQALFDDMKSRLLSPSSFVRLPRIAWNAPPAHDLRHERARRCSGMFAALAISPHAPPTRVLEAVGQRSRCPSGEEGLTGL